MRRFNFIAMSAGLLVAGGSPALARQSAGFITPGSAIAAPRGFVDMCAKSEGPLCDSRATPATAEVAAYSALLDTDGPTGSIGRTVFSAAVFGSLVPCAAGSAGTVDAATQHARLDFDMPIRVKAAASGLYGPMLAPLAPAVLAAAPVPLAQACKPQSLRPLIAFQAPGFDSLATEAAKVASAPAVEVRAARLPNASAVKMMTEVNRFVNQRVVQRTDLQMFGRGEVWRRSGTGKGAQGDCEDLAIEKRLELLARGFPADRLFFAVVYRGDVGLHTILIARANDGDYVLDSLTPHVVAWNRAPYSWISVQAAGRPNEWNSVIKRSTYPDKARLASQVPAQGRPI